MHTKYLVVVFVAVFIAGTVIGSSVDFEDLQLCSIESLIEGPVEDIHVKSNWGIDRCLQEAGWTSETKYTLAQRRDAVRKINNLSLADPLQVGQVLKVPKPQ